jgi:hypothetical protein
MTKGRQEKGHREGSRFEEWRGGLGEALRVAGSFVCRCPSSLPCSVSTPRSSNRTCGFPAYGSRTRTHAFALKRRCGQRRFKAFPVAEDEHSLRVLRYHFSLLSVPPCQATGPNDSLPAAILSGFWSVNCQSKRVGVDFEYGRTYYLNMDTCIFSSHYAKTIAPRENSC